VVIETLCMEKFFFFWVGGINDAVVGTQVGFAFREGNRSAEKRVTGKKPPASASHSTGEAAGGSAAPARTRLTVPSNCCFLAPQSCASSVCRVCH
jgi:hypothetical protein